MTSFIFLKLSLTCISRLRLPGGRSVVRHPLGHAQCPGSLSITTLSRPGHCQGPVTCSASFLSLPRLPPLRYQHSPQQRAEDSRRHPEQTAPDHEETQQARRAGRHLPAVAPVGVTCGGIPVHTGRSALQIPSLLAKVLGGQLSRSTQGLSPTGVVSRVSTQQREPCLLLWFPQRTEASGLFPTPSSSFISGTTYQCCSRH